MIFFIILGHVSRPKRPKAVTKRPSLAFTSSRRESDPFKSEQTKLDTMQAPSVSDATFNSKILSHLSSISSKSGEADEADFYSSGDDDSYYFDDYEQYLIDYVDGN